MKNIIINLPQNINIIIWEKKNKKVINIFLYNENKFYKLYINNVLNDYKKKIKLDTNTNSINLNYNLFNENNKISKFFFNFIKS